MRMVLMFVLVVASAGMHEAALGQLRPPLGGTTPSGPTFDRLHNQTTRPVPQVSPPVVRAPDMMWVPDRFVQVPGTSAPVLVPGHWERRLGAHEVYTPPLSGQSPNGDIVQFPAGTNPPVNERQAP